MFTVHNRIRGDVKHFHFQCSHDDGSITSSQILSQVQNTQRPVKLGKDIYKLYYFKSLTHITVPYALEKISAGFPSPAQDYLDANLDLNQHLIRNPITTFIVAVASLSMLYAGIDIDDELVVDRSIKPKHGDIVVAVIDNEFTVKRLMIDENGCWLKAENPDYAHIYLKEGQELQVWGVVTYVLKCVKK